MADTSIPGPRTFRSTARRPRWRVRTAAARDARPGFDRAQRAVGRRFEAVVDRVERAQRRRRGAMAQHVRTARGFRGQHGSRLRHQRLQVGRRPRRNEQRQHDAGERRVQSARVDARPQRDAQEGVRQRAVNTPSVEQRQQHGDRRGACEVVPVQRARVEQRDDDDRADVVDDRRSGEKDAKLDRHPLAEHHDQRDRERGVGGHRHTPAVAPGPTETPTSRALPAPPSRRSRPPRETPPSALARAARP